MTCALEINRNDGSKQGHVVHFDRLLRIKSHDRLSRDSVRSRGKLKLLYLLHHSVNGRQTW